MKSTVQAIALFTSAVSSTLGYALVGLSDDPLLVWNYGSVAVIALVGGIGFYFTFRKADREEDAMNNLKASAFVGKDASAAAAAADGTTVVEEARDEEKREESTHAAAKKREEV